MHDVERPGIGEAAARDAPWRSPDRTRSRGRAPKKSPARSTIARMPRSQASRDALLDLDAHARPCAWSAASACSRRAPAACRGRSSRRCRETSASRRCPRPPRSPNRRATARSCRHSVIAGLSALSTTSQPRAASTASSRVTASTASMPRGAKPARPRPHQAFHPPAGVAERLRRGIAEPAGGAEHEDAVAHACVQWPMIAGSGRCGATPTRRRSLCRRPQAC